MKKLFFLLASLCLHFSLCAQSIDTSTYQGKMDYLLQTLNKNKVTSGILYDRVEPYADLRNFGHRGYADTSSLVHYWQAWYELIAADYTKDSAGLVPLKAGAEQNAASLQRKVIPIGGLLYRFQLLDTNAVNNGVLVAEHETLVQNQAKAGESYLLTRKTFVGALLATEIKKGSYYIKADPAFWHCNTGETLLRYIIYQNGILVDSLSPGDSLAVNFQESGLQTFALVAQTGNGQNYTSYSTLSVEAVTVYEHEWDRPDSARYWYETEKFKPCGGVRSTPITATISFKDYDDLSNSPVYGQGEYTIYKRLEDPGNCGLSNIRKPIIILDGFDPSDDRKAETLYGKYLRYLDGSGSNTYLGDAVRNNPNQYDVIILNFKDWSPPGIGGMVVHGGADYVERNAMVLIELIKQINHHLLEAANGDTAAAEKLVIIGPSMGGLISRYALAYMEKWYKANPNNITWNHRCRLWISFDSPQRGANIAIGVQHFLKFFADNGIEEAKDVVNNQLGSVAAQQMLLLHHLCGQNAFTGAYLAGPSHSYRDKFVHNLENNGLDGSLGWPQKCRKIALINGSISGALFGNNCDEGTKMEVFATWKTWRFFNWLWRLAFNRARVAYGKTYMVGAPQGSECTVFDGFKMAGDFESRKVTLGSGWGVQGTTGLDAAPGGALDIFQQINTSATTPNHTPIILPRLGLATIAITATLGPVGPLLAILLTGRRLQAWYTLGGHSFGLGTNSDFETVRPSANFIPTKSALGFHWKNQYMGDMAEPLNNRNLVCTGEIPFDNYFGENSNTNHVSLTQAKVNWVMAELAGNPLPPPNQMPIAGPVNICENQTATYSVNLPPCNTCQYWWTVSGGAEITSGQGSKIITLSSGPGSSNAIIDFNANEGQVCSYSGRLAIRLGKPSLDMVGNYTNTTGIFKSATYDLKSYPGTTYSTTDFSTNCDGEATVGNNRLIVQCLTGQNCHFKAVLRATNTCGWVEHSTFDLPCYKPNAPKCIVNPPNPIKGTDPFIEVTTTNSALTFPVNGIIEDRRGKAVLAFVADGTIFNLDISRLEAASYTLVIDPNGENDRISFNIKNTAFEKLSLSPNPAFCGIDEDVEIQLSDDSLNSDSISYQLEDFGGRPILSWEGGAVSHFSLSGLQPGTYVVRASYGAETLQQDIDLLLKGTPYITLSPNPTADLVHVKLNNPVYEKEISTQTQNTQQFAQQVPISAGLTYLVSNGINNVLSGQANLDEFDIDLSALPSGIYTITVTDGMGLYAKHAQVVH